MSKGSLGLLSAYWPEGTARYGHIPLERVTQGCLHKPADAEGERIALVAGDASLSFRALSERTRAMASVLRARAEPGTRVAVVLADPVELLSSVLAALEADLLVWPAPDPPQRESVLAFEPALVIGSAAQTPTGVPTVSPEELRAGDGEEAAGRPKLRDPVLALPRSWGSGSGGGGEVLHSHRTLLATAIAWGSFFGLEPGSRTVLLDPPTGWLGLSALLGAWHRAGTVHAAWREGDAPPSDRVDYAVLDWKRAEARHLLPGTRPYPGRIGVGAIIGVESSFTTARRRRLARRLGATALTVYGRNDLGPVLASHPTWFLDDAAGIPLPNVDLRPLDPADGRELAIGWDAVEEAEMGVKSGLAPAGGELIGSWLRSRERVHVDPTGSYFLRSPIPGEPAGS